MGIFDFLKSGESVEKPYVVQLHSMIEGVQGARDFRQAITSLDEHKKFASFSNDEKRQFLLTAWAFLEKTTGRNYDYQVVNEAMRIVAFCMFDIELSDEDLLRGAKFINTCRTNKVWYHALAPLAPLMVAIEHSIKRGKLNPTLKKALETLRHDEETYSYSEIRKLNEQIDFLLQGEPEQQFNLHDQWGKEVDQYLSTLDEASQERWIKLFELCKKTGAKGEPTKKWIKEAGAVVDTIGPVEYAKKLTEWLGLLKSILQEIHKSKNYRHDFVRDDNHNIIKGLIWCTGMINDSELNNVLDDYAAWAYKKKPSVGSISAKTGTACMTAFAMLPIHEGVPRLSKFKTKIKNNTILKSINRIISSVADHNGVSQEEVQEMSLPDYGIRGGRLERMIGDVNAIYTLEDGTLRWERNGKSLKSPPAEIKSGFPDDIKSLKNNIKEIGAAIPVVKDRIERSYLDQRKWNFLKWKERYLDHPLASQLVRKLIWHFTKGDKKGLGFWVRSNLVDVHEQVLDWIDDSTEVQLWHPIGFSADEVLAWREFVQRHQITQPLKQAYREVYVVTDAELNTETYSNRFAAHVLRQHQFATLCKQRGWKYQLMGSWDSHNTPFIDLPLWNLTACYYVDADPNFATNQMGIYSFITTDQIRFQGPDRQPLAIRDVPAMVFTEIMRDVDLFVGVTSIGNDPNWQDGGNTFMNTYWQSYSFGELSESAEVRADVLKNLIPRMKIASQCSFDKKFLIVKGKVRTYKIHMGSGNIMMDPNDQYLCIVAGRSERGDKVFLPFEGDSLLSIIISKALLLVNDDKITDKTILSQINRR